MPDSGPEFILNIPNKIQIIFVRVPAGGFIMGSNDNDPHAKTDEKPQHLVSLNDFWISKYLITDTDYFVFSKEALVPRPAHWELLKNNVVKSHTPVVNVSANDAMSFCAWLSQISRRRVRLPSEEQWEKAARGTDGRIYPWGNTWNKNRCNGDFSGVSGKLTPVGQYSPASDSPYGCADMVGNVWEWTSSTFAEWTSRLVVRGACYSSPAHQCRCAQRYSVDPSYRGATVGFRVILD